MDDTKFGIHNMDAREIASISDQPCVNVTITSPPYFDLKDYGNKRQIGFGQTYDEYLSDLKDVFKGVYSLTHEDGSLWVIIDCLRKNGVVIPLPFDFVRAIEPIGWKLQEIIIWEKDKTVPWTHQGQMRNAFEYILFFSKDIKYKFYIDRVRQWDNLKKWWVRYPERYNPKGKTPEAIWHFPIPVQGSWGNNYIKHFCPLPEDLIAQIIKITTDENDVVLDPFAGSGAVLAKAACMKRNYIGTELNRQYIGMFHDYLSKIEKQKIKEYEQEKNCPNDLESFVKLILDLRALKYPRVLYKRLSNESKKQIKHIVVGEPQQSNARNKFISVNYSLIVHDASKAERIIQECNIIAQKPPLSKFGVVPVFSCAERLDVDSQRTYYGYSKTITHYFQKEINSEKKQSFIISPICVNLREEDYE